MVVDGKKISFEKVPKILKNVGSRVASIAKTATKKISNWYASRVKIESFEKMSLDKQDKVIKNQEQYFEDKANRLVKKDYSLASDRLEYDANEATIRANEEDIDSIVGDKEHPLNDLQYKYVEQLKSEKEALEKRNKEIKEAQDQKKNEIKAKLISQSNYDELLKKYQNNLSEYEAELLDGKEQDTLVKEKEDSNKLSDKAQIEKNLGLSFSRLDDRKEIDKIDSVYDKKIVKFIEEMIVEISKYNRERTDSILISERSKRDTALKNASDKVDELTSENSDLRHSLTSVQTDLENSNSENKRLEAEIERLKSENSLLVDQNNSLKDEKKAVHEELSLEKTKNSDLKNKISDLEHTISSVQSSFGVDIMNLQEAHKAEIENLKDTYNAKLASYEKKYEDRVTILEKTYDAEIRSLKKDNDNLRAERSDIAKILGGLGVTKESSETKISDENLSSRKSEIDSLNSIKNDLTSNYSVAVDSFYPSYEGFEGFFENVDGQAKKHK